MVHDQPGGEAHFDWKEDPDIAPSVVTVVEVVDSPVATNPQIQKKDFSKASLSLWGLVIVSGLVLEAIGLRSTSDDWPPLTHVIVAYVPWVVTGGFIAWLKAHFTQAYSND